MKFTFKTEKTHSGRYSSFYPNSNYVKLKKKVVGMIGDDKPHEIRLKIKKKDIMEDGNPNCEWRWVTLKKESETLQESKDWLNEKIELITKKYELWPTE